ncbi:hypothetical protein LSCM1_06596 [Leishmania martiniquensis]|uniref:Leucine-rich repeat protein n=1 Tax=Leishmania martiniquensis TaxID=1580590 RepID=A0A836HEN1_9TRYP|nr:hypothetical protein LSCM1_06596 [Leishmania martiniquensis]
MTPLPQQPAVPPGASPYITPDSKEKGDAGIYAAFDAMKLSRALHGVTSSRLDHQEMQQEAAARGSAPIPGSDSAAAHSDAVRFGMEPANYRQGTLTKVQAMYNAVIVEAARAVSGDVEAEAVGRGVGGSALTATAVGLPNDVASLRSALPLVHEVKPHDPLDFDALQRLFALMEEAVGAAEAASGALGGGVTALLLGNGVVDPARQPPPSTAAWEAKYREVYDRYPLPVASTAASQSSEDEDDAESQADTQNNVELQERCAALGIVYETHANAVRDVAFYELRVLPLLCAYLSRINERTAGGRDPATVAAVACSWVKVLDLSYNYLGAPGVLRTPDGATAQGDRTPVRQLAPLRSLAAMIDANESLRYLNLRANALGPRGVGIIAKAMTKNIGLCGIDLSANALNVTADAEEVEDPLYEPEDPVFGEMYEGLEALSEMLKKNKFLRVLRLAENGLHAGEDLMAPPPPEDDAEGDEEVAEAGSGAATTEGGPASLPGLSFAAAQERWQGIPLWSLLSPLYRYQRLRALDLSKNFLGNDGVHMLAVALSHNTSVEVLDLTDNAIGYAGLGYLARYVLRKSVAAGATSTTAVQQSALHTLILRQNPLARVGGAADVAAGVDVSRRRLTKRQQKSALAAMRSFAAAMEGPRGLRRLVLASTYLGPAFSSILLQSLARAEDLEELDFAYNDACGDYPSNFDGTAAQELATLLYQLQRHSPPRLRRVCFDGNNLTAAGVAALFPSDAHAAFPQSLCELTLSRNSLGDDLRSLGQLLAAGATAITHLDISYNNISTVESLLPGLATAAALRELNLSHNYLGVQEGLLRGITPTQQEGEVAQFFQCLAQLPSLEVLDISHNDWRAAHIEQLSAFFSKTELATALRKLDVRNTPRVPTTQLMTLLQYVASRPMMEVFMTTVMPANSEGKSTAAADASSTADPWTFDAVLQVIHGVVANSGSLLEVNCGLLHRDAGVASDSDGVSACAVALDEARERLLLNALMRASMPSTQKGNGADGSGPGGAGVE